MADAREQVVLDLEVEPAQVPGEEPVPPGKVDRGGHLVPRPLCFHVLPRARLDEIRAGQAVGELEHRGEHVAQDERSQEPEWDQPPGRVQQRRQHECPGEEHGLSQERRRERPSSRGREALGPDASSDELAEVIDEEPLEREQAVQQPDVEVLEAMEEPVALPGREAQVRRARLDVVVQAGDVRVGVMQDVVLLPPEVRAGAEEIEREAQYPVDARILGVAAVVRVVHHAEADARHRQAHGDGEERRLRSGDGREHRQNPGAAQPGQQHRGFQPHAPAPVRRAPLEVRFNAPLEIGVEGL